MIVSMDHSPSEQLTGNSDHLHTTVLAYSHNAEHFELSAALGGKLSKGKLVKWSNCRPAYRDKFEAVLADYLPRYPVHIRAVTANEAAITSIAYNMIAELQLTDLVREFRRNDKEYLSFGPFVKRNYGEPEVTAEFELPKSQALPIFFIMNSVLRTWEGLRSEEDSFPLLELMPNKFPGGINGRMASLFQAVITSPTLTNSIRSNIRIATLCHNSDDLGSALCDNIAGLLLGKAKRCDFTVPEPSWQKLGASFLWDVISCKASETTHQG